MRDRRAQVGDQAAQLRAWRRAGATWRRNGVAASSVSGVDAHAGQRLAGERAQRREGALRFGERGVAGLDDPGQLDDRLLAARRPRRRSEPAKMRKLVTRSLSCSSLRPSAADDLVEVADQAREVVRVLAEERLVDLRGVLERAGRGCGRAPGSPRRRRGRRARRRTPRGRSAGRCGRRPAACVRTWSSWTELRGLVERELVAVGRLGRAGAARAAGRRRGCPRGRGAGAAGRSRPS